MTIGPEPITITCWMSDLFGTVRPLPRCIGRLRAERAAPCGALPSGLLTRGVVHGQRWGDGVPALLLGGHQVDEPTEQRVGVVRAGGGLGVELHAEGRGLEQPQALHDVVV